MSILIKDIDMPKNGTRLYFATDLSGDVFARYDNDPNEPTVWYPVVEVPALMGDVRFPPERKPGRWIDCTDHLKCSECGDRAPMYWDANRQEYDEWYSPFCPNCGAKMEVEHETDH